MGDNSLITQERLQSDLENFYNTKVYPYLNGSANLGFTPIGTVISVMSNEAPENYLVCDGTAYNISEYSDLANFFEDQFGSKNFFGGNGTTTFAVPDLRGEFLRGTGTNSHTNQGSGGNVGEHQDATGVPNIQMENYTSPKIFTTSLSSSANGFVNPDYSTKGDTTRIDVIGTVSAVSQPYNALRQMVRPTNTSVLYCIAYKNIYFSGEVGGYPVEVTNPTDGQIVTFDATNQKWVNGGHKYSTNEHIVGTWIDGKPIYEKTFTLQSSISVTSSWFDTGINLFNLNVKDIVDIHTVNTRNIESDLYGNVHFFAAGYKPSDSHNLLILSLRNGDSSTCIINTIILQYTKTTDTV